MLFQRNSTLALYVLSKIGEVNKFCFSVFAEFISRHKSYFT